jgi:hypothetical protein
MYTEEVVKGRPGGTGLVHFFFPPLPGQPEFGVQGKPIAEIRTLLVSRRIGGRLGFPAIPGRTGAVEAAVFANADILSADLAAQGTAYGIGGGDRGPAIPAHRIILTRNLRQG